MVFLGCLKQTSLKFDSGNYMQGALNKIKPVNEMGFSSNFFVIPL